MVRYSVIVVLAAAVLLAGCAGQQSKETSFYLSLTGNDSWSGKLPEPNKQGTDGPFASFDKARDAVRTITKAGQPPKGGVTVYIRGGIYSITKPLALEKDDSGAEKAPIIWRAYLGEEVKFIGGSIVKGFEPVTDPEILKRIDSAFHNKIIKTDLKAQGITEYGDITPNQGLGMELFFKDKVMTIARYPNEGWLNIRDVPQSGEKLINAGDSTAYRYGLPAGRHYGRFIYDDERPKRWAGVSDLWMYGYWVWDWSDSYQKIKKIDTVKKEIYPIEPYHHYGYRKNQRYYYLNILEELDTPGEYFLDRFNGILYFWPPEQIGENDVFVTTLADFMVSLKETSYITIRGITFDGSRAAAAQIEGGSNNTIAGCTIRNIRADASVIINGGTNNGIRSSDIFDIAATGVKLSGGDRKTITSCGNYADNNHVHHYGMLAKAWKPAFYVEGVGMRISHNYVHDAPFSAVQHYGNDNIYEYNEIHDIAKETDDVGGFNTGFDFSYRGNIMRYNYFHHIHSATGHVGAIAMYNDLPASGTHIYGNIVYKVDRAFLTNSGRDNIIENNIFVECDKIAIHINHWRQPWMFQPGGAYRIYERLFEINYNQPPYSTKYPDLVKILNDGDPAIPRGNKIIHNICYKNKKFLYLSEGVDFNIVEVRENVIADSILFSTRKDKKDVNYTYGNKEMMDTLAKSGNAILNTDPGFVDLANGNFNLREDSPALKLGFKPIPFNEIGLYVDEYRTTLPKKGS